MRDNRASEVLLHFIWQFRYFNPHELFTEAGEALSIQSPGEYNLNQGPDFLHARISIGGILREGPVELHVRTSDWHRHAHDGDIHYQAVILHVVWENDLPESAPGSSPESSPKPPGGIPLLVLRDRTSKLLLSQYRQWMNSRAFVPCEHRLKATEIDPSTLSAWNRQLLLQRLQQRTLFIYACLEENRQHWEETTWWLLARSLGLPVNGAAFLAIARSLPLHLLIRQRDERARLEALLLGQAGLLEGAFTEEYPAALQKEYRFCCARYSLTRPDAPLSFMRMRPGHFPGIRLVQLAGLLTRHKGWFAVLLEETSLADLMQSLDTTATGYWTDHYIPQKKSVTRPKPLGEDTKKGILINAFIPMLFAYGALRKAPACQEKALRWLDELGPENNTLVRGWRKLGIIPHNAGMTQSLLELKKSYCNPKKCLDCSIGQALLAIPAQPSTDSN